jgi:hypothetical protein
MATIPNSKALTASDGTNDHFNVNTVDGRIEIPHGKYIQMYSDNYTTVTAQLRGGTVALAQSATAPAIADGATIATNGIGVARIAPAAARTGIILEAGAFPGQEVWVINEAAAANTVTFAAASTSFVADGASSAIAGLTARKFVWNSVVSRWFRAA